MKKFSISIIFLFFAFFNLTSKSTYGQESISKNAESSTWPSIKACVDDSLKRINSEKISNSLIYETNQVCYTHLHAQGLLNDFNLRRLKFVQQAYDERVLLWMVVIITLSGVALAGIQMMASFRLASHRKTNFPQSGELIVEQGKLSLKSSITGLFILVFSFAFFWVFVYEIFVIKEVDVDGRNKSTQIKQNIHPNIPIGKMDSSEK